MHDVKPTDYINRFYDEMAKHNFAYALEAAVPDYYSLTERHEVDPESLMQSCKDMAEGMSDLRRRVIREFNDGDYGVVLHEYSWVDEGSGKRLKLRSADMYQIRDKKLACHWGALQLEDSTSEPDDE